MWSGDGMLRVAEGRGNRGGEREKERGRANQGRGGRKRGAVII